MNRLDVFTCIKSWNKKPADIPFLNIFLQILTLFSISISKPCSVQTVQKCVCVRPCVCVSVCEYILVCMFVRVFVSVVLRCITTWVANRVKASYKRATIGTLLQAWGACVREHRRYVAYGEKSVYTGSACAQAQGLQYTSRVVFSFNLMLMIII